MEDLVEQAIMKGWKEPIFVDEYAKLINYLTESAKPFISKKNVKFVVLEKVKEEYMFTFKSLGQFLEEVSCSKVSQKDKDIQINSRKDELFGNLYFVNSLLKSKLIP